MRNAGTMLTTYLLASCSIAAFSHTNSLVSPRLYPHARTELTPAPKAKHSKMVTLVNYRLKVTLWVLRV